MLMIVGQNPAHRHIRASHASGQNWYIVNNSFLTHGYANYKHLVIKTDTDGRQYLGVPGVSEPQERMMAGIFGFTEFEPAAPANAADVDSGVFGYWFCQL